MSKPLDVQSFDAFAVPPPSSRTLLHETAGGQEGSYEIAIFEMRNAETVMWIIRKRILFPVEKQIAGKAVECYAPGWTSELHLSQLDLLAMGKQMLGTIIGKVSGESLQVLAARDQVLMELRTKLKEHLELLASASSEQALELLMREVYASGPADYHALLTTIRLIASLIKSQLAEREEE